MRLLGPIMGVRPYEGHFESVTAYDSRAHVEWAQKNTDV